MNNRTAWIIIALGAALEICVAMLDVPPMIVHIGWDGIKWGKG